MEESPSLGKIGGVLLAIALTVLAFVAAEVLTLPLILADPTILEDPGAMSRLVIASLMALNFVGFALVGALYLWLTGRGWAYVDLEMPDLRDGIYLFGGTVAAFGLLIVFGILAELAGIEPTESQVLEFVGEDPTMILIMIAIVFLFNAPAEEFLFRNVIQKRLYEPFTRLGAIAVTSVIFAIIHLPMFAISPDGELASPDAIAVSLTVIFAGSVVFGYVYARTDNLAVPIGAHALFNAIQFGILYLGVVVEDIPAALIVAGA